MTTELTSEALQELIAEVRKRQDEGKPKLTPKEYNKLWMSKLTPEQRAARAASSRKWYHENKDVRRAWTEKNRDKWNKYKNERRAANKLKAVELMGNKCAHCNQSFHHAAYDFHHTDPNQKDFAISDKTTQRWESIEKELAKCMLLCSNCHRIHHHKLDNAE